MRLKDHFRDGMRLYPLIGEKHAAALAIKPDKYGALSNWGIVLARQAKSKAGEEADRLFAPAAEEYAAALAINQICTG
jgi:hypothetical protein